MEVIDRILGPFERMRGILPAQGAPGEIFVFSIITYAVMFILAALVWHWLFLGFAHGTRWCAKRISAGARLEDVERLESSSARIEAALRWLATRIVQTSYGRTAQGTRPPEIHDKYRVFRIGRRALRRVWLMIRGVCVFISALPGFFLSGFGMAVLVASTLTAFPDAIRAGVAAVSSLLETVTWSQATLAAIVAAAVPLMLVVAKVLVSERSVARRSFRRERDIRALGQLYNAASSISALAHAVREQMHETIRMFKIEKARAEQWYEWTQRTTLLRQRWNREYSDHVECDSECLQQFGAQVPARDYSNEVKEAVAEAQRAWNEGLNEARPVLARVTNRRAWAGLVSLWFCFSRSGKFRWHKLPARDAWKQRRIAWQHHQLLWSDPTEADAAAGRTVAVRATQPPGEGWMERELHNVIWELAELTRELDDLADYARALTRPPRLKGLERVSEG